MMKVSTHLLTAALVLCAASAWSQPILGDPQIGYLYPAGGQQGSTVIMTVGGQALRNPQAVYVTGEGVHARVVRYVGRMRPPNRDQRDELMRRMKAVRDRRLAEEAGETPPVEPASDDGGKPKNKYAGLPSHPLLHDLDNKSLRELEHIKHEIQILRKGQQNAQLAESVIVEVTIDPKAAPGMRELRMLAVGGLTNPVCFQVGQAPEIRELEPNGPQEQSALPAPEPLDLPIVVNGQVMPGDVDQFRFRARKGQRLVVNAQARSLIPYLADAVPGWFQATVTLYDAKGREVAFSDDYEFNPDPVLCFDVPKDGVYTLEIQDAIYRGRDDFVYRVAVGEFPFVTCAFPLGAHAGDKAVAEIDGWNISKEWLRLASDSGEPGLRQAVLKSGGLVSNPTVYAVDSLPDHLELEPNDTEAAADAIELPVIVNGRILEPGDTDLFKFSGSKGDVVVVDVAARRLNSPMDSLVRLMDRSGDVIAWNDDNMEKDGHLHTGPGLLTHHADSYLRARLPKNGDYYVCVSDSQSHGGPGYAYRVRISAPQPDFAVRVTPSSVNIPAGRSAVICVHALRTDGFSGDVQVSLADAPKGFTLEGGHIPADRDCVRMTLTAPPKPSNAPAVIRLEGTATVEGETVSHEAVPCEDMMQAFLWRHLVPAEGLLAMACRTRYNAPVRLARNDAILLSKGEPTEVLVRTPASPRLEEVRLELSAPPDGVVLKDLRVVPEGLAFLVEADGDAPEKGFADNLIVQAFIEPAPKEGAAAPARLPQRVDVGVLPAIPFEIVQ